MAVELNIGVISSRLSMMASQVIAREGVALTAAALEIEQRAKKNASNGSHPYGTRTPASPGSGPARISGTLVRSITHDPPLRTGLGWETKVGTAGGLYPLYRSGRSGGSRKGAKRKRRGSGKGTPSSEYGKYLETGLRNGATYPWLTPAYRDVVPLRLVAIFTEAFAGL